MSNKSLDFLFYFLSSVCYASLSVTAPTEFSVWGFGVSAFIFFLLALRSLF